LLSQLNILSTMIVKKIEHRFHTHKNEEEHKFETFKNENFVCKVKHLNVLSHSIPTSTWFSHLCESSTRFGKMYVNHFLWQTIGCYCQRMTSSSHLLMDGLRLIKTCFNKCWIFCFSLTNGRTIALKKELEYKIITWAKGKHI